MSGCSGNCSTCNSDCGKKEKQSLLEPTGEFNNIKHIIAVVSGKGGVGKSTVTSMLAVEMSRKGYKVGVLDADITGPSIPKAFGIKDKALQSEIGILPAETKTGIKVISVNMMLEDAESPVVWRGPVIAGLVKQFWQDVVWGDLDYLFIDCPPGTGDVPLTVFQMIPLDGIVTVTTPQDLVSLIVKKALNMANMMNIPVIGIVENLSYFKCPDCGKEVSIFGDKSDSVAKETGVEVLARMPINPEISKQVDMGLVELFEGDFLQNAADRIENFKK